MKTVFNNRDVAKVWAAQSQHEGRSRNLWFEGPTIFSYHSPIASYVDSPNAGRVILYTTQCYSNTTSKHKGHVWSALYKRSQNTFIKVPETFHVPYVDTTHVTDNAQDYLDRINELTAKQKRARKVNREFYQERIESLRTEYRRYCEAFGVAFELLTA